jgi:hypothetical protein
MYVKARHLNSDVDYYVTTRKLLAGIFQTVVTKIVVQDILLNKQCFSSTRLPS